MNYRRVFIQNSYVHIIILSYERNPIFIKNIKLLRQAFKNAKNYFSFDITAISVLPDHIHFILKPADINEYPRIITSIKYYFSKNYVGLESPTYNVNESSPLKIGYKNKREKGIFQHRYYEHTIVDENELNKIIDYIHYNPVKHGYVDKVKNWAYSSFKNFVDIGYYDENWCDFSNIKNLDLE